LLTADTCSQRLQALSQLQGNLQHLYAVAWAVLPLVILWRSLNLWLSQNFVCANNQSNRRADPCHHGPRRPVFQIAKTWRHLSKFRPLSPRRTFIKGGLLFTITTTTTRRPCIFDVEDLCTASREAILVIIELNQYKIVL
jgi:hypothetical protein